METQGKAYRDWKINNFSPRKLSEIRRANIITQYNMIDIIIELYL